MNFDEWWESNYPEDYCTSGVDDITKAWKAWNAAWKLRGELDASIAENSDPRTMPLGTSIKRNIAKAIREVDDEL